MSRRLAAVVGAATILLVPGPARAADDVVILPGFSAAVIAADLDADGSRELVRLVAEQPDGPFALEAWSRQAAGWTASARLPLAESADGALSDPEVGTMITWRAGGSERLLLAVSRGSEASAHDPSLVIGAVGLDDGGMTLDALAADPGPAERIQAADLDGDGADELVITEPTDPWGALAVRLLRWTGDRFETERIAIAERGPVVGPVIGESDGTAGVDLVFSRLDRPELMRIAPREPDAAVERIEVPVDQLGLSAWPHAAVAGATYVSVDSPLGSVGLRITWPAGDEPVVERFERDGDRLGILEPLRLGNELFFLDDTTFALGGDELGGVVLRDSELQRILDLPISAPVERARRWGAVGTYAGMEFLGVYGYAPAQPFSLEGTPAAIVAGHLLRPTREGIEADPSGSMTGVAPVGLVGPDDGWMVLSSTIGPTWISGYLAPIPAVLAERVAIAPVGVVLMPEADDGALEVELRGATRILEPDGPWVASRDGGFEIVVRGDPGSRVATILANRIVESATIGNTGTVVLPMDPRPHRDDTVGYNAEVVLVTPTGHFYATEWPGRVLREPPSLEVSATTHAGEWSAGLVGSTDTGVSVTVGDEPVTVRQDGTWRMTVGAGIVPTDLVVRAVDAVGNETARRVEIVGFVDHRGWPWVAIVGAATVLAGAVMYLRVPRRPEPVAPSADGATIEELEVP